MNFSNFQTKKFELARGPSNMQKIRISEGTRQKIRIGEHFELLDFELESLDCISNIFRLLVFSEKALGMYLGDFSD